MGDNREDVAALWAKIGLEVDELPAVPDTFKPKKTSIPTMRVRKIMNAESFAMWLLDREKETRDGTFEQRPAKRADHFKFMFSACSEAVMLKAAEFFIQELTVRAYHHTKQGGRKILGYSDVKNAVNDPDTDMYDFLIDIIPKTETTSTPHMNTGTFYPPAPQEIQQQNQLQAMAAAQNSLSFATEP